ELPVAVKRLLDERRLEMGHARALASLPAARATALAEQAAEQGWTVRELEDAVRRATGGAPAKPARPAPKADPNIDALERELAAKLATRVKLAHGRNGRGKLVIHYHSADELEGILERIR
ncbi:MAG TPA: chromosome partitioning protein ParB, partial [Dokdonella sp.]